jgi:hypothetical protein
MTQHVSGRALRREERDKHILLAICSHIANGAKHFNAERPHHKYVAKTHAYHAAFQSNAFQGSAFQTSAGLTIKLDGSAAIELGEKIEALLLAEKVIVFWMERIEHSNPPKILQKP